MDARRLHLKSLIKTHLLSDPNFQENSLDSPPTGIFCADMEEPEVEYVSPGFWRSLGIPPQDGDPGDWRKYLFPADVEKADLKEEGITRLRFFTAAKRLVNFHCRVRFLALGSTDKTYRVTQLTSRLETQDNTSPEETSPEPDNAVFLLDPGCRVIKMNPAAELISGVSQIEAKGKSINDVLTLHDQKTGSAVTIPREFFLYENIERLQSQDLLAVSRGRERIPVRIQGSHISDANLGDRGSLLVLKDIRRLDSIHELVHARMSLIRYAADHPLEAILHRVLDEMGHRVDSPVGFFHFVEEDCQLLSIEPWHIRSPNSFSRGKKSGYAIDRTDAWADCLRGKKAVIRNNDGFLPPDRTLSDGHSENGRALLVPVIRNEHVVAVMGVAKKEALYTDRDIHIVSYFADITWEIVLRKRMDEEMALQKRIDQELADLSELLLTQVSLEAISEKVLETGKRLTKSRHGYVGTWDPRTAHLTCHTMTRDIWEACNIPNKSIVFKNCTGLFGWVLNNRTPLMLNDIKGDDRSTGTPEGHIPIRAFLCVPAMIEDELVGQISLANPENHFLDIDLKITQRLANLYALAVQRQRYHKELLDVESRKADELEKEVVQRTQELARSTQLMEDIFNSQQDAILVTDAAEIPTILNCNPAVERIFGYRKSEILGRSTRILFDSPDQDQAFWKYLTRLTQRELAQFPQHRKMCRKDHRHLLVNVSANSIKDSQGIISGWVLTFRDDSKQQEYQEKLRRSREEFRAIAEYSAGWETWVDPQGSILWINPAVKDITGYDMAEYSREKNLFRRLRRLIDPDDLAKAFGQFDQMMKNRLAIRDLHLRIRKQDGSRAWISISSKPIYGEDDRYLGTRISIRDITEKKEIEKKVTESEARLTMVMDAMRDAIWDWRIDTGETYFSPRYYTMLGYAPYELPQSVATWRELLHPDDAFASEKTVSKALSSASPFQMEFRMRTKSGDWKWILARGKTVEKDHRNRPLRMVGTHMDITRRKELDDRLRQSQKLEAVGTLAGGIAHDFNNILAGIIGYAELVMDEINRDSKGYGRLKGIINSSERARELIGQILTFSRKTETERHAVDIRLVVKEALTLIRATLPTTITINQHIQPSLPFIMSDPTQIHQIIMNLSTNALHAMPEGGELNVELTSVSFSARELETFSELQPGTYLKLTVRDSGIGIPPDVMPYIFDPFFTTKEKEKGTGLGLSVVHGIVRNHGGEIRIDSAPGQGTQVDIYLPCRQAEVKAVSDDSPKASKGEGQILLVDDEEVLSVVLHDMLEGLGYTVTALTDSVEAYDIFTRSPDTWNLLLTDVTMPGLTGTELARAVRRLRPDLPIILWSGDHEGLSRKIKDQFDDLVFLKKPFRQQELAGTIQKVLKDRPAGD